MYIKNCIWIIVSDDKIMKKENGNQDINSLKNLLPIFQ